MTGLPEGSIPASGYISRSVFCLEHSQELGGAGWVGRDSGLEKLCWGEGDNDRLLQWPLKERKLFSLSVLDLLFLLLPRASIWMSYESHGGLQLPLAWMSFLPMHKEKGSHVARQTGRLSVTRGFSMQSK